MNPNKVLVALSTFGEYGDRPLRLLQKSGLDYTINKSEKRLVREEIIALGQDCTGIIAGVEPYDDYVLERLPQLRCISRCGAGVDNINLLAAQKRGILILNTAEVVVQPVVELTLAMIFDLLRKLSYHTILMREKRWEKKAGHLLGGIKVGIIGLGRIGKKVAEVLKMLRAEVCGYDPFPDPQWAHLHDIGLLTSTQILQESDIISLHLAPLPGRPFRLGGSEIQKMKRGAMIINTARGELIDEAALYEALSAGHLAGAALDVFPQEPYYGKLSTLETVVLTPHLATLTEESRLQMETEATANLIKFLEKL